MRLQVGSLASVMLVVFAVSPLVYAYDSCSEDYSNASIVGEAGSAVTGDSNWAMAATVEQAANIGDPNAAMLVAVEQEANFGDSNAAMLVAAEQDANIGERPLTVHAAIFGNPETDALACYFGPC